MKIYIYTIGSDVEYDLETILFVTDNLDKSQKEYLETNRNKPVGFFDNLQPQIVEPPFNIQFIKHY